MSDNTPDLTLDDLKLLFDAGVVHTALPDATMSTTPQIPQVREPRDLSHIEGGAGAIPRTLMDPAGRAELADIAVPSFDKNLGLAAEVIKDFLLPNQRSGELLRTIGSAALEGGKAAGNMLLGTTQGAGQASPQTFDTSKGTAGVSEVLESEGPFFTDPQTFASDPFRAAADVGAVASGLTGLVGKAKLATLPGRTGQFVRGGLRTAEALDPANALAEGVRAVDTATRGLGRGFETAAPALSGLMTGRKGPRSSAVLESSKRGETAERRAATRGVDVDTQTLGDDVVAGMTSANKEAREPLQSYFQEAADQGITVDLTDLKNEILGSIPEGGAGGLLAELKIAIERDAAKGAILVDEGSSSTRISINPPPSFRLADAGKFEEALRELLESPSTIPVEQLHEIKVGIGGLTSPTPRTQRVINAIRTKVREALAGVEVPSGTTYDQAIKPLADFLSEEERLSQGVGVTRMIREGNKEVNTAQLGLALSDAFEAGNDLPVKMKAMARIDELIPDGAIRSKAAGAGMGSAMPSGLVGTNQFVQFLGAIAGTGALAAQTASLEGLIGTLLGGAALTATFIPKVAAEMLSAAGATSRELSAIRGFMKTAILKAQDLGINPQSLTLGELINRIEEVESQPASEQGRKVGSSLLSNIGMAGSAFPPR